MENKVFNWGIIGPGRIANKFAQGLKVVDNAILYAVASSNLDRAKSFSKEYGAIKSYNSYEELTRDPKVDAIYVATPHRFHFENTKLCLEAGKSVLCEKPFTVNANEAKILIDLASRKNVFLMEALWTRYLPIYNVVKKWIADEKIGGIKLLTSTFGFNFERNLEDRKFNNSLAGGALLDLGIYPISISQWLMQQNPESFSAVAHLGETKVDEMLAVNLKYNNGAVSQFSCNFLSTNENDFLIYGTKGYIRIHGMFWGATKATLYLGEQEFVETRPFKSSGFEYQIEEATNCMKAGKLESSIMPLSQTLENLLLMDNIRKTIGLKYSFE